MTPSTERARSPSRAGTNPKRIGRPRGAAALVREVRGRLVAAWMPELIGSGASGHAGASRPQARWRVVPSIIADQRAPTHADSPRGGRIPDSRLPVTGGLDGDGGHAPAVLVEMLAGGAHEDASHGGRVTALQSAPDPGDRAQHPPWSSAQTTNVPPRAHMGLCRA